MNFPPIRTNANVAAAGSDASGSTAFEGVSGFGPVASDAVGRVGLVDGNIYRLAKTTPTA